MATGEKKSDYTVQCVGGTINGKGFGETVKLTENQAKELGNKVATKEQLKKIAGAPKKVEERYKAAQEAKKKAAK